MGLASTSEQIVEQEIFFQSAHASKQASKRTIQYPIVYGRMKAKLPTTMTTTTTHTQQGQKMCLSAHCWLWCCWLFYCYWMFVHSKFRFLSLYWLILNWSVHIDHDSFSFPTAECGYVIHVCVCVCICVRACVLSMIKTQNGLTRPQFILFDYRVLGLPIIAI